MDLLRVGSLTFSPNETSFALLYIIFRKKNILFSWSVKPYISLSCLLICFGHVYFLNFVILSETHTKGNLSITSVFCWADLNAPWFPWMQHWWINRLNIPRQHLLRVSLTFSHFWNKWLLCVVLTQHMESMESARAYQTACQILQKEAGRLLWDRIIFGAPLLCLESWQRCCWLQSETAGSWDECWKRRGKISYWGSCEACDSFLCFCAPVHFIIHCSAYCREYWVFQLKHGFFWSPAANWRTSVGVFYLNQLMDVWNLCLRAARVCVWERSL